MAAISVIGEMPAARGLWTPKPSKELKVEDFSYLVVGLPRSGTTLVCRILEALGIQWLYKDFSGKEWSANSAKYMELSMPDKFPALCSMVSVQGIKAVGVKWLLPFEPLQLSFLMTTRTKVILCKRDLEECGRSTEKHFNGKRAFDPETLNKVLEFEEERLNYLIPAQNLLKINYNRLISDSAAWVGWLSRKLFLTDPEKVAAAVSIVDPSKNNQANTKRA